MTTAPDTLALFNWIAEAVHPNGTRFIFDLPAEAVTAVPMEFGPSEAEMLRAFAADFVVIGSYFGLRNVYSTTAAAIAESDTPSGDHWATAWTGWEIIMAELRSLGMQARVDGDVLFSSLMHLWALNTAAQIVSVVFADAILTLGGIPFKDDTGIIDQANQVYLLSKPAADELEEHVGNLFSHLAQCA
jgi:hypothetical protein